MLRTLGRHLARSAFVRSPPPSARRADAPQALPQQAPPPPPAAFAAGRRWAGAASGELALATPPSTASLLPPAPPAELDAGAALTPQKVVELLDRYIVGQARALALTATPPHSASPPARQADAKRAVAVALRNRWRRQKVGSPLKEDIGALRARAWRHALTPSRPLASAQKHPDDWTHRLRQDRDRAPAGEADRRALHQGASATGPSPAP